METPSEHPAVADIGAGPMAAARCRSVRCAATPASPDEIGAIDEVPQNVSAEWSCRAVPERRVGNPLHAARGRRHRPILYG
jgi:hypothetical protein